MINKKIISVFIFMAVLQLSAFAFGTAENTVITIPASTVTLNYYNGNLVNVVTQNASSVLNSTAVIGVEGLTANVLNGHTATAAGVTSAPLVNVFTNRSNKNVTISATHIALFKKVGNRNVGTIAQWKGAFVTANYANVPSDARVTFNFKIKPASNATNLSVAQTTLNIALNSPLNAQNYRGFNNLLYGGFNFTSETVTASVSGPEIALLNRYKIVSTAGMTGYTGTPGATVPGAKIKYVIVVKNIGQSSATFLNIDDPIPTNTTFFDVPSGGDQDDVDYKVSGIFVDNAPPVSANVQAIKFKKINLPVNSIATFNYTVTVN